MYTKEQAKLLGICLRAQAIADAIGEDFEFRYDPKLEDLHDLIESRKLINITDDTQMTMFGIEAMLKGGTIEDIKGEYIHWYNTQAYKWSSGHTTDMSSLYAHPLMWQRRAPGNTCMNSLKCIGRKETVTNNSNGCGTVMKALPFLFEETCDLLVEASLLTHKGPQILETAENQWGIAHMLRNKMLPNLYKGSDLTPEIFGDGGWQAEPCFNIALWAFENCNGDFEKLLELAILHEGDSDSVAATAAVLYGLYYETYPTELYDRVVERDVIELLLKKVEQSAI